MVRASSSGIEIRYGVQISSKGLRKLNANLHHTKNTWIFDSDMAGFAAFNTNFELLCWETEQSCALNIIIPNSLIIDSPD
jgi:hypothetical protein